MQQGQTIVVLQQGRPVRQLGRYGPYLVISATKTLGALVTVLGIFSKIGAILEVIGFAIKNTGSNNYFGIVIGLSQTSYAGFWCGFLIMIFGSIISDTSRRLTDAYIIAAAISSILGLIFSLVLIGLSAPAVRTYNSYNINYVSDYTYAEETVNQLLIAGWAIMLGSGSLSAIMLIAIACLTLRAIICGYRAPPSNTSAPVSVPVPQPAMSFGGPLELQQQPYQQQNLYPVPNTGVVSSPRNSIACPHCGNDVEMAKF